MPTLSTTRPYVRKRRRVYGPAWNNLEYVIGAEELRARLEAHYIVQALSVQATASALKTDRNTVVRYLKRYGIPLRGEKALRNIVGQKFGRLTVIKRFGEPSGRREKVKWVCRCECGNELSVIGDSLKRGNTLSCGCYREEIQRGENHRLWRPNGHKKIDAHGYVKIRQIGHPNANERGYVLEHHFVMSEHLGRPIWKRETVHHKYGDKTDNRLESLELWSHSHPYGQRVVDKIAWCVEFLSAYAPEKLREPLFGVGVVSEIRKRA